MPEQSDVPVTGSVIVPGRGVVILEGPGMAPDKKDRQ
jgi:hypothetical protein